MAWTPGHDHEDRDGAWILKVHFRVSHPTLTTAEQITAYVDTVLLELAQANATAKLAPNFSRPYCYAKLKDVFEDPNSPGTFWIYPKLIIGGNLKQNRVLREVLQGYIDDLETFGKARLEADGFTVPETMKKAA